MRTPENIQLAWDNDTLTITINTNIRLPPPESKTNHPQDKNYTPVASTYGAHHVPLPNGQFSPFKLSLSLAVAEPLPDSNTIQLINSALNSQSFPPEAKPLLNNILASLKGFPKSLVNYISDLEQGRSKLSTTPPEPLHPLSATTLFDKPKST